MKSGSVQLGACVANVLTHFFWIRILDAAEEAIPRGQRAGPVAAGGDGPRDPRCAVEAQAAPVNGSWLLVGRGGQYDHGLGLCPRLRPGEIAIDMQTEI